MVNFFLMCFLSNIPGPPKISLEKNAFQLYPISKRLCSTINPYRDLQFELYTRKNPSSPDLLRLDDDNTIDTSNINFKNPTVMFFHGYLESSKSPDSVKMKESFLKRGDYNVILVNSERLFAGPFYINSALNAHPIGNHSAAFIDYLVKKGLDLSKLHVIGMSLGAQIAGYIGKNLKSGKLARITGLDPAGPYYDFPLSTADRLSKADAEFVDVIHSNYGIFGTKNEAGHVDIWLNGGTFQPGCDPFSTTLRKPGSISELVFCNHYQAWRVYVQSLNNPGEYIAYRCDKHSDYKAGKCNGNNKTYVGPNVNTKARGNYYIDTGVTALKV